MKNMNIMCLGGLGPTLDGTSGVSGPGGRFGWPRPQEGVPTWFEGMTEIHGVLITLKYFEA